MSSRLPSSALVASGRLFRLWRMSRTAQITADATSRVCSTGPMWVEPKRDDVPSRQPHQVITRATSASPTLRGPFEVCGKWC
jgi:hypothetical protein